MRKTKKQLLGLAGLIAVGVMTAVAYSLPAPDAAAASEDGHVYTCDNADPNPENHCPSTNEGVSLQVFVTSPELSLRIVRPKDKTITVASSITAEVYFSNANWIEFYLTHRISGNPGRAATEDEVERIDLPSHTTTPGEVSYAFDIPTSNLELDQEYQFHAVAHGNNQTEAPDTSTFTYRAITAEFEGKKENNDPILGMNLNEKVDRVSIQVYKAGKPLFVDEDGNEVPLVIDPTSSKISATLPFEQYNADTGEYTATITAYHNNSIISMVTANTYYTNPARPVDPDKPSTGDPSTETPDVPNTGLLRIGSLNITRLDYLLTGLIAFGLAACFALYLIFRKKRRH